MNKKKIIIGIIIAGAVLIIALVALGIARTNLGMRSGYQSMDAGYEKSALPRMSSEPGSFSAAPGLTEDLVQSSDQEIGSTEKKIIKNGDLTLKVASVDKAAEDISSIAKSNNGEIFSTNFYQSSGNIKSGTVTVKVPVANFEKTFSEIKKVASLVVLESTSGQDVTEQYTDLQSRLKNKQAEEQAFAKILERSGEIDDVLKVTRELARVRGEIEILQGRIKYLESQADMSMITANISEDQNITISDRWRPLQVIKESINSLIRDIQKYVNFVIILIIQVIPIIILYTVLVWIAYLIGRKIYRKVKEKTEGQQ